MSLLLDALKKAALEKQQANAALQSLVNDESDNEDASVDELGSVSDATDQQADYTSTDAESLELELQEGFDEIDHTLDHEDHTADQDIVDETAESHYAAEELQLEAEVEEPALFEEPNEHEEEPLIEPEPHYAEEPVVEEAQPQEALFESGESDYIEEEQPEEEAEGFGEAFEYEDRDLQGGDLADDILAQFQEQMGGPPAAAEPEATAVDEVSESGTTSPGGQGPVGQDEIDAMVGGAFCASESEDRVDEAKAASAAAQKQGNKTEADAEGSNMDTAETEVSEGALNQLINQTGKREKGERTRRTILGVVLLILTLGLGSLYYYLNVMSNEMKPLELRLGGPIVAYENYDVDGNLIENTPVTQPEPEVPVVEAASEVDTGAFVNKPGETKPPTPAAPEKKKPVKASKNIIPARPKPKVKKPIAKKKATRPNNQKQYESIQIDRRTPLQRSLEEAYLAFHQDQYGQAKVLYTYALKIDKGNRDALLGLAAVATKVGDYDSALEHYQKLLTDNPVDDVAQAGLMQVSFQHDSTQVETRLKLYIENSPNSAFLRFALGNVYANRQRWKQASVQYREAVSLDPMNADFNYNLAVSYDQLGLRNDALFKYQHAQSLALGRSVNFSAELVRKRIAQLQSSSQGVQ